MQTTRQQKIERLLQQELGDIFLREMKPRLGQSLVSVTHVHISPDLSIARIHASIYPIGQLPNTDGTASAEAATPDGVMQLIREQSGDVRRRLGLRVVKQLRIVPTLDFYIDDSLDYMENINRLLRQ